MPSKERQYYPIIIGEHGTGKTSLILLAMNDKQGHRGIIYVDSPTRDDKVPLTEKIREALDFDPDPKYIDPKLLGLTDILKVFARAATRYKREFKKIPVLIVDNANRLTTQELELMQDYAKHACDRRIATLVFVSSEGRVPGRMIGDSPLCIVLLIDVC
jgi:hypothetical protein